MYRQDSGQPGVWVGWRPGRLITKENIRRNFPGNFLGSEFDLEYLLETEVAELEHTSGTIRGADTAVASKGSVGRTGKKSCKPKSLGLRNLSRKPKCPPRDNKLARLQR